MGYQTNLFDNKTVLITGAGKGIGRACALMAANCGAKVIAVARTKTDLESLSSEHGNIEGWALDINSDEFLNRLKGLPVLHGLINNAGTNRVAPMSEQTNESIDAVIDLNIRSIYKITQAALTPLKAAKGASIVNMSSQMGFVGSPGRTLYCMSKHAVEGLTKSLAVELAQEKLRVNSVAPTFVETPMTKPMLEKPEFKDFVYSMIPMKELANVEDVANACIFLLSDLSRMVTGTSLKVDGGWTAQ
ncbi:SDR family NAD(P)-dependent oxidoreductase [Thalassomonas sp. M1454]|uniref:SDR family NAD(P)-dependent oxidoreductase n=1 Tax=Thalassomonas sp. M1454 TaxID=2594477 RepID=UPI0011816C5F|nr:SDR family NAD(P)-dependent oxidoreductase [Thalassomonas sp. M1454]TRX56774.1 SDR family oxidoreductase [Thalassomonas sp. M1454]